MDSRRRLSYRRQLFLLLVGFSWAVIACSVAFQYGRERRYKAERLDARLQLLNTQIIDALSDGLPPEQAVAAGTAAFPDLRITVLDRRGGVRYDTSADTLTANHLDRPEIARAIATGTGYTIRRHSQSTDLNYFYSAMSRDAFIVRSALPYSLPLQEILAADRAFLWFMLAMTLAMSVAAYFATRRLGHNITRLDDFARRAERGERIEDEAAFPDDELGSISNHIVRLYARLQRAMLDRDREHAAALHAEQERIRIKKQLTNNINHELKTPVASIRGYLETLLAHPELEEPQRRAFIEKSLAQSERLGRLLSDVGTITRMDEGSRIIQKEPVELGTLIEEVLGELAPERHNPPMRVECDLPPELAVEGNPSLLGSVFRNLADNALAYSGGRTIRIRMEKETETHYHFSFADDGTGVGEEHLAHLFERFYRVDKGRSRKMGGTGLGLAIVKNAILLHGGRITAHNRAGGGLEFRFSIGKHS